jgi:2-C-methyl-D-erythritol 4-phosphate cytidylyltransferase
LPDQDDWVLVHDMARPCVATESINQLIKSLSKHQVGGILAAPVNETLKRVNDEKLVVETVERSQYWDGTDTADVSVWTAEECYTGDVGGRSHSHR